jgi:phosphopantetheine adenylyltransferase
VKASNAKELMQKPDIDGALVGGASLKADEFIGIINYSLMALIQIELGSDDTTELEYQKGISLFETKIAEVKDLMMNKNHDYGEAWREMRVSSMTDLILMKLKRIKQIEDNHGATLMSEGVDANYQDIINYAAFALIKLDESK